MDIHQFTSCDGCEGEKVGYESISHAVCMCIDFVDDQSHKHVHACKRMRLVMRATQVCIPSFVTIINPLVPTSRRPTVNRRGFGNPRFDLS